LVLIEPVLNLLAIVGHLVFGLAVLSARTSSGVKQPLAALCFTHFGWSFASVMFSTTGDGFWHHLDVAVSVFLPALMFHLLLAFIGRRRELRAPLLFSYAACGVMSSSALLALFDARFAEWTHSLAWSAVFLVLTLPLACVTLGWLIAHGRAATLRLEKQRVVALEVALLLGVAVGFSDVWGDFLPGLPQVSLLGCFLSTAVIAACTLRLRLLDATYTPSAVAKLLATSLCFSGLSVLLLLERGMLTALYFVGITAPLAIVLVSGWEYSQRVSLQAERARYLSFLGRASAQMSHDLRNPLAALKGAVQFLEADLAPSEMSDRQRRYLALLGEQIERIQRAVERYDRVACVEARPRLQALTALIERVASMQVFVSSEVRVQLVTDTRVPEMWLDGELFIPALENVVQNALDASRPGSTVWLRTELLGDRVHVSVQDTGSGMDARQRERAIDEFYTTKARGSGLGLTLAKRVAEAHGGTLRIQSHPDQGTTVTFELPLPFEPSTGPEQQRPEGLAAGPDRDAHPDLVRAGRE
jgi:signal transduction histidine kinase